MPKTAKTKSSSETEEQLAAATHEEIALRAYHIYLERGSADGSAVEDWHQAERELAETSDKLEFVADAPQSRN